MAARLASRSATFSEQFRLMQSSVYCQFFIASLLIFIWVLFIYKIATVERGSSAPPQIFLEEHLHPLLPLFRRPCHVFQFTSPIITPKHF